MGLRLQVHGVGVVKVMLLMLLLLLQELLLVQLLLVVTRADLDLDGRQCGGGLVGHGVGNDGVAVYHYAPTTHHTPP